MTPAQPSCRIIIPDKQEPINAITNPFIIIHVLMRDEKEGRKKQARSNKQQGKATQHTQGNHFSM